MVTGICPTVESDEEVSPEFDDERDEYICPQCELGLTEDENQAETAARRHLV